MQKKFTLKGFVSGIFIGLFFAGTFTFATALWHGTDWIEDGEVISAEMMRDNFDYLIERTNPNAAFASPPICTGDDALQWDGEEWGCTGGFSGDAILITEAHTQEECIAEGGSMHETPDGYVCKMPASSCPAGWSQYQSWSTTGSNTCVGEYNNSTCTQRDQCTTSSHAFSSTGRESCKYTQGSVSEDHESGTFWCRSLPPAYDHTCYATVTETGCI